MLCTLLSTTTAGEKGNHEIVHFKLRLSVIGIIDQTEVKMNFKVYFLTETQMITSHFTKLTLIGGHFLCA